MKTPTSLCGSLVVLAALLLIGCGLDGETEADLHATDVASSEQAFVGDCQVKTCSTGYWFNAITCACEQLACSCPTGFAPTAERKQCTRVSVANPISTAVSTPVVAGDRDDDYGLLQAKMVSTSLDALWPFQSWDAVTVQDGAAVRMPVTPMVASAYWRARVGGLGSTSTVGIKVQNGLSNVWYTKAFCLPVTATKDYTLHVDADNEFMVFIDGSKFAECRSSTCFQSDNFFTQNLKVGTHTIELKYSDSGEKSSVWFEVFDNTQSQVKAATKDADLKLVLSTKSLVGTSTWDYRDAVCPDGYAWDGCGSKKCTLLEYSACTNNVPALPDGVCGVVGNMAPNAYPQFWRTILNIGTPEQCSKLLYSGAFETGANCQALYRDVAHHSDFKYTRQYGKTVFGSTTCAPITALDFCNTYYTTTPGTLCRCPSGSKYPTAYCGTGITNCTAASMLTQCSQ